MISMDTIEPSPSLQRRKRRKKDIESKGTGFHDKLKDSVGSVRGAGEH